MSALAPIVLFVYNRTDHARETVEALKRNALAAQSDLIIFSDAPRSLADAPAVNAVRQFMATITGFASVQVVERVENLGLARSIISGVTDVVNRYGKVIVLEDDIVAGDGFLVFMNQALDFYTNEKSVMSVNAYVPPLAVAHTPEVFYRAPSPWGWATWADRWQFFAKDADAVLRDFTVAQRHQFDFESTYPYIRTISRNQRGELNTWAVFWYATVFRKQGLCVSPPWSLVENIGHDGSGENCRNTSLYRIDRFHEGDIVLSTDVVESRTMYLAIKAFNKTLNPGLASQVYMLLLGWWRNSLILILRLVNLFVHAAHDDVK